MDIINLNSTMFIKKKKKSIQVICVNMTFPMYMCVKLTTRDLYHDF